MQLVLSRLDGVEQAKVSFRQQRAWVVYDPAKVTVPQMVEAVGRSGFGARPAPDGSG